MLIANIVICNNMLIANITNLPKILNKEQIRRPRTLSKGPWAPFNVLVAPLDNNRTCMH